MSTVVESALSARFLRGLARAPSNPAFRVGTETMTYREVHESALRWAGSLVAAVGHGAPIGVLADPGVELYVGVIAAQYAGSTVVPLHPDFPATRTRNMVEAAGVRAIVADERGRAALEVAFGDTAPPVLGPDGSVPDDPANALITPLAPVADAPACVLFTSGSTGLPKGVALTNSGLAHYFGLLDARYDFGPDDVFSQTFDVTFDCSFFDMFCAWGAGACVVRVPPRAYRELASFVEEAGVTVWFSTPSAVAAIRRFGGLEPGSLPGLRWSFFAGEALTCADVERWEVAAPNTVIENLYGPTELTITIAAHRWNSGSAQVAVNGVVPIGAVHGGHDHVLLGPDDLPALDEGELCVTGPQMAGGYLDPAEDAGRFLDYDGRRWYRTGDRVRRIGDELAYLGRADAQVQVKGWRVELAEVDNAVRTCAGVTDAVTVSVDRDGSAELVVCYTGTKVPRAEIARALRVHLPEALVPRQYVHMPEFPLNVNRKIDRGALEKHIVSEGI